jgi:hypothetical protein
LMRSSCLMLFVALAMSLVLLSWVEGMMSVD